MQQGADDLRISLLGRAAQHAAYTPAAPEPMGPSVAPLESASLPLDSAPSDPAELPKTPSKHKRLTSLDVIRGFTMVCTCLETFMRLQLRGHLRSHVRVSTNARAERASAVCVRLSLRACTYPCGRGQACVKVRDSTGADDPRR